MKSVKMLIAALLIFSMLLLPACGGTKAPEPTAEPEVEATAEPEAEPTAEPEPEPTEAPEEEPETEPEDEPETEPETEPEDEPDAAASADGELKIEGPMIVTTCGQSPGATMMKMIATTAGVTADADNALSADTFEAGDYKTLVVTTGTSGKGMGAAGTDVDDEIERCTALIEKAREAGLTIVCAHIEGMARRTDNSDQASIDAIIAQADMIVAIEDSDSDGLFTNYAAEHNIPIIIAPQALDLSAYIA